MNVKRFVCCLLASVLLLGVSLISCGNSSRAKAKNEIAQSGEDFKSFLDKFTSSAAFQYTRIKFPLKTPITLLADDGETEKTFPFTKEKWPLLDSETMKEERIEQEEGGIYVSKFTLNERFIKCSKQVMRNQKSTCVSNLNRLPMGNGM